MEDSQEIAISENFICPNQTSVNLLRKAQQDESVRTLFGDGDIRNFTIYTVPNRVVEILSRFESELYGKVASGEITPIALLEMAREKYHDEEQAKHIVSLAARFSVADLLPQKAA